MKKYIFVSTFLTFVTLSTPTTTHALINLAPRQGDGATTRAEIEKNRDTVKKDTKEKRAEIKTERKENRDDVKAERKENRADFLKKNFEKIKTRINAGIERLTNVATRVTSRNEKLKADGIDTTASETLVRQASDELAKAKTGMDSIEKIFNDAVASVSTSETTSANSATPSVATKPLAKVRGLITEVEKNLRNAKMDLQKAVVGIKKLEKPVAQSI